MSYNEHTHVLIQDVLDNSLVSKSGTMDFDLIYIVQQLITVFQGFLWYMYTYSTKCRHRLSLLMQTLTDNLLTSSIAI